MQLAARVPWCEAQLHLYLIDTDSGPAGLRRPDDVTPDRMERRERLIGNSEIAIGEDTADFGRLKTTLMPAMPVNCSPVPNFHEFFDLQSEDPSLRQTYGGEFGQRCLLARRLVESGVRFVEVSFNLNFINGTGWDTHNDGQLNQHMLIQQLDQALAALIDDLESRKLLDSTLIVVATEFGRPPEFDGGGGRGHQSKAFSVPLFGRWIRSGTVIGVTDEFGRTVVEEPVSVPDLHATIYTALGIDPQRELFDGDRPVPITDHGVPIQKLFS